MSHRPSRRAGFTLLELVVALVVTGVVALLAYSTLRAGLDTEARVERTDAAVSGMAVARALLLDALRHLPEGGGASMNDALFVLEDRTIAAGMPGDALAFVSYGVGRAPGASAPWSVSLTPTDDGVRLRAIPLDAPDRAGIDVLLPGARGLDARVLARSADADWLDAWSRTGRVPAAVRIQLLDGAGRPLGVPLVAQAALEAVP